MPIFRRRKARTPSAIQRQESAYYAPRSAIGCRFCNALRELLSLGESETERFNELWSEGDCFATVPATLWTKVTPGNDGFSQYDFAAPANPTTPGRSSALWFRDSDMSLSHAALPSGATT